MRSYDCGDLHLYANVNLWISQVLDVHAYEARQREYALEGHKHFYFMTLNGSEVWLLSLSFCCYM